MLSHGVGNQKIDKIKEKQTDTGPSNFFLMDSNQTYMNQTCTNKFVTEGKETENHTCHHG